MKRWITIAVGLLISAVALYFAFRDIDVDEVWAAVTTIDLGWALAACVLVGVSTFSRGVRWSVLLQRRLPIQDSFWLWVTGFMLNNFLPLKIGEVARSVLAGRRPGMSFTAVLSSVVVERLFDIVAVVSLLGISLSVLPQLPDWAKEAGLVLGAGAVTGLIVLAVAARNPAWALNLGSKIIGVIPRVGPDRARAFLSPFVEGLGGVSNWQTFLGGVGLTIVSWAISILGVYCMMTAFWGPKPLTHAILALSASGLGVSVPSAPSGVGTFQAAVIALLTAAGYDRSETQGYAIVIHAATFAVTSLLGFIGLLREGVSFSQIAREAQEIKSHPVESGSAD